ncbi:BZ3500_MvSof-1268-A1-R1_Chr9g10379 [Microbotryum saponariae]|uniref:BZ3500_MvSof-1268-A1-R1_Chr9g10379 protein n=1 Tax=Microbotryum saponariae TaxID=289078 RepID=A0A2X0L3G2_9BASI|nr:BZ3501_MvSof-1269-A2-R1_Chr9g10129 [Microbotryum saponariae]SCZ99989.1 BZ3500_MvSof-1268-A1-R1_Chr9g10379 [Microbotryum saponariae]
MRRSQHDHAKGETALQERHLLISPYVDREHRGRFADRNSALPFVSTEYLLFVHHSDVLFELRTPAHKFATTPVDASSPSTLLENIGIDLAKANSGTVARLDKAELIRLSSIVSLLLDVDMDVSDQLSLEVRAAYISSRRNSPRSSMK